MIQDFEIMAPVGSRESLAAAKEAGIAADVAIRTMTTTNSTKA